VLIAGNKPYWNDRGFADENKPVLGGFGHEFKMGINLG